MRAQLVSVPKELPMQRAADARRSFTTLLGGMFAALLVLLDAMLWWLVMRPLSRLSALADRVSLGAMSAPAFAAGARRDEIGVLGASFNRMRRSLAQAMKMLEMHPHPNPLPHAREGVTQ